MRPALRVIRKIPIHFILFSTVVCVVTPAVVLNGNSDDIATFRLRGFAFLIAAAVFVIFILVTLDFLQRRITARPYFSRLTEFACFFVIVTGFIFPASVSSGMTDPWRLEIDEAHVGIALFLAVILFIVSASKFRKSLYFALILFVVINAAMTLPGVYSLSRDPDFSDQKIFSLSAEKNILVLSFDGIPASAVSEVLAENPALNEKFAGFTFYDRAASSSPATSASTATSLYGNRNFKISAETDEKLWDFAPEKLLTKRLERGGYVVSAYGIYNLAVDDKNQQHAVLVPRHSLSPFGLLNYSIARCLTRLFVIRGKVGHVVEGALFRTLRFAQLEDADRIENFRFSHSPDWKKVLAHTKSDFVEYVSRLQISTEAPVAQFLHFTYTHFPVELDRDCRFWGQDRSWFDSRQNRAGVKEEVYCALTHYAEYLDRLKELDAFDRSLIVLKSDHGKPVEYGGAGSIEALRIRDHELWGYGRYAPLLAIKNFDAPLEGPMHSAEPVMLDDLPITLCVHSGISGECLSYGGYDLLGGDFSGIENSEVTLYIVKSADSDFRYDDHEAITVRRGESIVGSLYSRLTPDVSNSEEPLLD